MTTSTGSPTAVTAPQGAIDYAVNRLRLNLTELPERRDPELLLKQILCDLGIELAPAASAPTGRAIVKRAYDGGMHASGWDVLIVYPNGTVDWSDRAPTRADARALADAWNEAR